MVWLKKIIPVILILLSISCYTPQTNITWDNRLSKGYYHPIRKGDTIYSIARYYRKDVNVLLRVNKIKDPRKLEIGSWVFIPTNRFAAYLLEREKQSGTTYNTYKNKKSEIGKTKKSTKPIKSSKTSKTKSTKTTTKKSYSKSKKYSKPKIAKIQKKSHAKKTAITKKSSSKSKKIASSSKWGGARSKRKTSKSVSSKNKLTYPEKIKFIWPIKGKIIAKFNQRGNDKNFGIDIAAPKGTKIIAAQSGKVIHEGSKPPTGYGNIIIIDHSNGYTTVYGHNDKNLVKTNQYVHKGKIIATVGHTGNTSRNMLHFEIRKNAKAVDPLKYLR